MFKLQNELVGAAVMSALIIPILALLFSIAGSGGLLGFVAGLGFLAVITTYTFALTLMCFSMTFGGINTHGNEW